MFFDNHYTNLLFRLNTRGPYDTEKLPLIQYRDNVNKVTRSTALDEGDPVWYIGNHFSEGMRYIRETIRCKCVDALFSRHMTSRFLYFTNQGITPEQKTAVFEVNGTMSPEERKNLSRKLVDEVLTFLQESVYESSGYYELKQSFSDSNGKKPNTFIQIVICPPLYDLIMAYGPYDLLTHRADILHVQVSADNELMHKMIMVVGCNDPKYPELNFGSLDLRDSNPKPGCINYQYKLTIHSPILRIVEVREV